MIDWTILIVLLNTSALWRWCTICLHGLRSRHLMAKLRVFFTFISPDASLIHPPQNPQQFVRGFCDFRRVSNKYNSTCTGRSRPHGVHVARTNTQQRWWMLAHYISRRRFHRQPRRHGHWSGISRVSKPSFTSYRMNGILKQYLTVLWFQKTIQMLYYGRINLMNLVIWKSFFCNSTNWMISGIQCNVNIVC